MDDVPARIDHTVLGPETTPSDVDDAVDAALELGTNVCVPPCYVGRARERLDAGSSENDDVDRDPLLVNRDPLLVNRDPLLVTVVGFPHGQHAPETLTREAQTAVAQGADELDVVINVGRLRAGEIEAVRGPLAMLADLTDALVKAIVQAPLLDDEELERACEAAADAGCSHVKTATGFDGGATTDDVAAMAEHLPVKASGGIGSWTDARGMFEAGADRIGASSGDDIVREWRAQRTEAD